MENSIRLNKYLANLGIASRRKIDEMVEDRRIIINGKVVMQLGTKVNPEKDIIEIDNKIIERPINLTYVVLNKPRGIISSVTDDQGRKTVIDMVKIPERLYPVGRLDQDSQGLILLTNDGEITYKLTHPKFHVPKVYEAMILGQVKEGKLAQLRKGVRLEDGKTAPAEVKVLQSGISRTLLEITIFEGRKRQIRRMTAFLHLHLMELKRVKIGPIEIGDLKEGSYRYLTEEEIEALKQAVTTPKSK